MTQYAALKAATDLHDVAHLLGYKTSALAYLLYKLGDAEKYKQFEVPKRSGGKRIIKAPIPELKRLQRKLLEILEHSIAQINADTGRKDQFSHGFKKGRSIFSNAAAHRNHRWVFNMDLEDFFGTINFGRVRGFFMKDRNFLLHEDVATILAQIACSENSLPQGSPVSPIISNLIGNILDIPLGRLAGREGCMYSRYADDLTFSTNKPEFPTTIAVPTEGDQGAWGPSTHLRELVAHARFSIHPMKTRMQFRDSRQEVTGLVVNEKLNVRPEYRRTVRAMVHRLLNLGHFEHVGLVDDGTGKLVPSNRPGTTDQLHGMLGFIDSVDRYNKELQLPGGGKLLEGKKKPGTEQHGGKTAQTGKEHVYKRFLLYKEFFASPSPVIVCEGETDNVYLIHAIRSMSEKFPTLATSPTKGEIRITPRIFKYVETSTGRILELSGGSADLGKLMRSYDREIRRFVKPSGQHPFVLLIDNDSGATGGGRPFQVANQITKTEIDRKAPFIHVTGNLYLVPTPLLGEAKESMIEDFFDAKTLAEVVDGKTFSAKNKQDSSKHYGKKIFAHKVIRPKADAIDFTGFAVLLGNIELAFEHYYKKHPHV